ncbi:MAG: ROK family protein [Armatimonadota bacterium]|nr:ROK family protein [Armatimonadota bacterium]MDR7497707.1 ROK family protein [Armatimonadota bacterium]
MKRVQGDRRSAARPAASGSAVSSGRGQVIGIDLGGTKVAVGLVSRSGEVSVLDAVPTLAADGAEVVIERLAVLVREAAGVARNLARDVVGVGLATPGIVDSRAGTVRYATPALPGWTGLALGRRLAEAAGLAVVVHNDGHAAAVGESAVGAAAGVPDAVVVVLGTGIGGGIIAGGRLVRGHLGGAGRIGHLSVDAGGRPCWCGARGCIEQYASGSAVAREAQAAVDRGAPTTLRALSGPVSAADVVQAARGGDALAVGLLSEAGRFLGAALVSLVNLVSPQVVVVGGGLADAGALLLDAADAVLSERLPPAIRTSVEVRLSSLGHRAAVAGAGLLAWGRLVE